MSPTLTLFTTPKPMTGPAAIAQRNAIGSWLLIPGVEVIVMGGGEDADAWRQVGVSHVPDVEVNRFGTPTLSGLFDAAHRHGRGRHLTYINADIILLPDFARAVRDVAQRKRQFLMVGRRTDLADVGIQSFGDDWAQTLAEDAERRGRLSPATAIDYFTFPRGAFGSVPAFAIGRTVWDNWLIYRARQLKLAVVDTTQRVLAVHQDHDYEHVSKTEAGRGRKWIWNGPEARQNLAMAGGKGNLFTLFDSTHRLVGDEVEPSPQLGNLGGGVWSYRRSANWQAA